MLCPICQKEVQLHNAVKVNEQTRKNYICEHDRILVNDLGEIILTDFKAKPNMEIVKQRLSTGFDFSEPYQITEFTQLVINLVKYTESLEKQLNEKNVLLSLLRNVDNALINKNVMEVNDE